MLAIGLTGGIGSGKSTVTTLFKELGAPIIDTDVIAREITEPTHPAFTKIVQHFGMDILTPSNTLNRQKLRTIVFANEAERKWLEALLHPLIFEVIMKKLSALRAPYCLIVIPLLIEVSAYAFINRILVVDTPLPLQISRVLARDMISETEIHHILKSQVSREQRLSLADDIIVNDGALEDLMPQVQKLHEFYTNLAAGNS